MSISPKKWSSAGIVVPVGQMLGNKFFSFAKSRLPVPNQLRTRTHRHAFLTMAPISFAPLVDKHAFQPLPPYSARPDDTTEFLPVPHNTPEGPVEEHSRVLSVSTGGHARPIGLGLEGIEKGDGGRFDGLGRLSGGLKASSLGRYGTGTSAPDARRTLAASTHIGERTAHETPRRVPCFGRGASLR